MKQPTLLALALFGASVCHADSWSDSHAWEARGDYAAAARSLEPMVRVNPPTEYALLRYGWLHYRAGDYNEALDAYQKALALNPASLDARLGIALPLLAQKRWNQAEQHLRQALKDDPLNYTLNTELMQVEEAQQQWSALGRHARDFSRRYPSDATTLVYFARASLNLDDKTAARAAYRQVLARYPSNTEASNWLKTNP